MTLIVILNLRHVPFHYFLLRFHSISLNASSKDVEHVDVSRRVRQDNILVDDFDKRFEQLNIFQDLQEFTKYFDYLNIDVTRKRIEITRNASHDK